MTYIFQPTFKNRLFVDVWFLPTNKVNNFNKING